MACGTGLVAKQVIHSGSVKSETFERRTQLIFENYFCLCLFWQMKKRGFELFVGVDGSDAMLNEAKESGLYQDLKQCLLGEEPFPALWGNQITCPCVFVTFFNSFSVAVVFRLCPS